MAGRSRKIIAVSTGKIGKKAIEERKKQEEKIRLTREELKAPEWLPIEAQLEFQRVVRETAKIEILDNLDLGILAIYCNAYYCYTEITKKINSLMIEDIDNKQLSIFNNIQEKYVKQIMQCSTKLGLATTDRLKLVVPVKEEKKENKFFKYLEKQA